MADYTSGSTAVLAFILFIIGWIIYYYAIRNKFHGGGGGGHGGGGWHGGGGGWHGGGGGWRGGRGLRGGWGGGWGSGWWGWPNYYPYYYDDVYITPDTSPQKIGYAVSADGTITLDLLYGGKDLYMFSNNGVNVKTEKRTPPFKDDDTTSIAMGGVTKVYTIHLL